MNGLESTELSTSQLFRESLATDLLDSETLTVLRDLDQPGDTLAFLDDVLSVFCIETPLLLGSLAEALYANDISSIALLAHQLKGLCGNVGITRLAAVCDAIEENVGKLSLHRPLVIISLIENTYRESVDELEAKWKKTTFVMS